MSWGDISLTISSGNYSHLVARTRSLQPAELGIGNFPTGIHRDR